MSEYTEGYSKGREDAEKKAQVRIDQLINRLAAFTIGENTIEQRDHWEEKATELAGSVAHHFGIWIGEHTSANCPVQNAIDYLEK